MAQETWTLSVSGTLYGDPHPGLIGLFSATVNGVVTLHGDSAEEFTGIGDMTVNMTTYSSPYIINSPLSGSGKFTVRATRDGANLLLGRQSGNIKCKGTQTIIRVDGKETRPHEISLDIAAVASWEKVIIERREGARATVSVRLGGRIRTSVTFTLSGGTNLAADHGVRKGEFPAKENLWTLELEYEITSGFQSDHADFAAHSIFRGKVEFPLPLGDGEAKGVGECVEQGNGSSTKPIPMNSNWKNTGELILDGKIQDDVLIVAPRITWKKLSQAGTNAPSLSLDFGPGFLVSDTEHSVSIPVENGAQVVEDIDISGPERFAGRVVWRLRGKKRELWRITIEGRDLITNGGNPERINRPTSLPKTDPNAPDVKWSEAACGLRVAWNITIDVEIEDGKYRKGLGKAALASITPYSEPPGVYSSKSASITVIGADGSKLTTPCVTHPTFSPYKGVKTGDHLELDLYSLKEATVMGCYVAYEAKLDVKEAEQKIAFWNARTSPNRLRLRRDVTDNTFLPFPFHVSVLLIDGWQKAEGDEDSVPSEVYKVRRVE